MIVRHADDSVLGFESKNDVDRFLEELRVRFAQFGLTLNEDKTRVLQFGLRVRHLDGDRGPRLRRVAVLLPDAGDQKSGV